MAERKEKNLICTHTSTRALGYQFHFVNIYSSNKSLLAFSSLVTELRKGPIGSRREMRGAYEMLNAYSQ